jgi:hypothetical protein
MVGLLLIAIVNWLTSEDGVAAIGPTGEAVHTFEDRDIASIVIHQEAIHLVVL